MKTRILSACIMLPLLLFVYFGGIPLELACLAIGIMGAREFIKGFEAMDIHGDFAYACVGALALYCTGIVTKVGSAEHMKLLVLWFFLATVCAMLLMFVGKRHEKPEGSMVNMLSLFYIVFFSYHVYLTDQTGEYRILIWLIFLTAFGTDIFAYFTGYAIGKHKLCPTISPKKTIEGAVGGTVGSVLLCFLFGYFFAPQYLTHCMVMGLGGAIISQFGDLTASIFKRRMGIKDYGNLIPGHGGIMDRFDSILFTAPLVYYYITFVMM